MTKEQIQLLHGNLVVRNSYGDIVNRAQNVMTSGGLSFVRDCIAAATQPSMPAPPAWIVYGSGNQPVGRFWTQLPSETYRTPIVSRTSTGGSVVYHWFVMNTENIGAEVGMYGLVGGAATSQANTGTLIAVANEPNVYWKDSVTTYSGDWTITVSGVVG